MLFAKPHNPVPLTQNTDLLFNKVDLELLVWQGVHGYWTSEGWNPNMYFTASDLGTSTWPISGT